MMKYFRHLALVSPIIKVFLCFLAGFGFDAVFFNKSRWKNPLFMNGALAASSLLMLGVSFFLYLLSHNYYTAVNLLASIVPAKHTFFRILLDEPVLTALFNYISLLAILSSILFAALLFIDRKRYLLALVIFLSVLHCADIYGFKFSEIKLKATPLNEEIYKYTDFQSMPYAKRRDVSFLNNNPRTELLKVLPIQYGAFFNWAAHSFLFKDELGNSLRTDHWLLPLDNYMRAYWGQSIHDLSIKPLGLIYYSRLDFPQWHPAILKISGVTEDKIQFFSGADIIPTDDKIASLITNSNYKGDIIFLSPLKKKKDYVNTSDFSENDLSASKRLRLPYQVLRFDANNLEITTDTDDLESSWLFYSDVWHPLWRATVNGKETPVYKANLAYKAVKLDRGFNKVHFYFKSQLMSVLYFIFGLNALCWLVIILYLTGKIALNNRCNTINYQKPD